MWALLQAPAAQAQEAPSRALAPQVSGTEIPGTQSPSEPPSSWLNFGGFIQAEYIFSQLSEDQLADGTGQPLNEDRFLIPRARLALQGNSPRHQAGFGLEYILELDINTLRGTQIRPWRVEGAVTYRVPQDLYSRLPLSLRLGAGMIPTAFGYEEYEQVVAERTFLERSMMTDAFFPGQLDLGARLSGLLDFSTPERPGTQIELTVALQNGQPLGDSQFPTQDPNRAKDLSARAALRIQASRNVRTELGFSGLSGTGFHDGTLPNKESFVWRDYNQDGIVQVGELRSLSPSSGSPSENFSRWGLGADARVYFHFAPLGMLSVYAEAALGNNLDRGVRPADPVALGRDQREIGLSLGFTQELGKYAIGGFRFDYYRPELDYTELQNGTLVRAREEYFTYAPIVGLRLSLGEIEGRLLAEYAFRQDPLGRDASAKPADLKNNTFTTRAQVSF